MSAFIVLAVVSIVAFAAMRLSMSIFFRAIDKFKRDDKSKKLIKKLSLILTPLICLGVFLFPLDYGPPPRDLNIWITFWSLKTICIFMSPAIIASLTAFYLQNKG